ncbi:MAG: hypothetical protein RSA79_02575 [Oscillospiraceae bacterium]
MGINISVPRASYISFAFTEFIKSLDIKKEIDINYRETNSNTAFKNVIEEENNIGIIRYKIEDEDYYFNLINENNLKYKNLWQFKYVVLMSNKNPLSKEKIIDNNSLKNYVEIVHGDVVKNLNSLSNEKNAVITKRKISIYERASQFELLREIKETFMQVSPIPNEMLTDFSLVQKNNIDSKNIYKDIIIYKKDYNFSQYDIDFLEKLNQVIKNISHNK